MKKTRTLLSIFWAVVIAIAVFVIPAIANENDTPDESVVFNITTDKKEYKSGEKIELNLLLENKNQFSIKNIIVNEIEADGFEISDNTADFKLGALGSGETMSATYTFGIVRNENSMLFKILMIVGAVLTLGAIVTIVVLIVKKKKAKVAATTVMCLVLTLSMLPVFQTQTFAQDKAKKYSAEADVEIEVDGEEASLKAKVEYVVSEENLTHKYTVSFNTDGGNNIAAVEVEEGQKISEPETPVKEGYVFAGWFADEGHTEIFLFEETPVVKDMTLYAGWIEGTIDDFVVAYIASQIDIVFQQGDNINHVTRDVGLPTELEGVTGVSLKWISSDELISEDGEVTRPENEDEKVTLTLFVEKNEAKCERQHVLNVIHKSNRVIDDIQNSSVIDIENMNPEGELDISYNDDKTQVTSIEGKYSELVVENADDALDAIQGIRTIVGVTDPYNELKLVVVNSDEYGAEYTFAQVYNGYEVYARRITVSANLSGVTDSLGSGFYPSTKLAEIDTNIKVAQQDAEKIANNKYGGECKVVEGSTNFVYYTINEYENSPVFAYRMDVAGEDSNNKYTEATIFIDSQTGEIAHIEKHITGVSAETGSGKNELGQKVSFPVVFTWTDWYFYYMQDIERDIQMYNQAFDTNFRIGSEINWWTDETAISAYTNMIKTFDWFKNTLNRNSLDGNGMNIKVVVHNDLYDDNAFWHGGKKTLNFCDNSFGSSLKTSTAAALDVVAHEFTHGVVDYITGDGLPYENATGAIDEGYADIFGCLIDGDWQLGEDWMTLRDASNPTAYEAPDKLSSPFYVDYTVDSSDGGGVHTNSSLVYHAAYLMNKYGMSKTTLAKVWYKSLSMGYDSTSDFYTVRRNVLKAAKKMNLDEELIVIIKKAFDEVEIFGARGTLSGTVTDVEGNPIVGAEISFEHNGAVVDTTQTDNNGSYSVLLDAQNYSVKISADDYVSYVAVAEVFEEETAILNATLVKAGNGTVCGTVVSATSAMTISNVTLNVRSGLNMKNGTIIKTAKTNNSGLFNFELEAGYYTIEMVCEGYTTGYVNVLVNSGESSVANGSLSPVMTSSTYRVVLSWGRIPYDLDSHLYGETTDGSAYHVYYLNKEALNSTGREVANLDVDDINSYGPETTTFVVETEGKYEFVVHRYSFSGSLPDSGATVEVYNGTKLIAKFIVDSTQSDSYRYWNVFTIENGIFKTVNTMR
ncbi:MAG: M4 family metallopeptidase [Clostridia bacterium]|nr:M4 family metallopeptidase [Clostridia bacterium]